MQTKNNECNCFVSVKVAEYIYSHIVHRQTHTEINSFQRKKERERL